MKALKRKQMLYQVVQDEVKSYILRNDLKAGDPLPPETELAQQLDVSRNSVREAVKGLEALGILETRQAWVCSSATSASTLSSTTSPTACCSISST
jgi:DNA-binding FadR family transcriptional regulator